ncbi:hypothetical protein LUZ61_004576 [Rhynchospora tenuis]|uniref:Myb/SANT-like DNA-binding domain-containing protein n=1 Tax=Rhynchospora tenuis TaxID=198213 RepID=A0AAD6ETU5_9POAL|nr:hypothetical protein LUZ61_004576 [Rhynchospora tenuis]
MALMVCIKFATLGLGTPPSPSPSPSPPASPPVAPAVPLAPIAYTTPLIQNPNPRSPHPAPSPQLYQFWVRRLRARGLLERGRYEVADAVTSREGYTKLPKSDVQCKNRIDTLKKKYKVKKSKAALNWPFFGRLDLLLGPTHTANKAISSASPNSGVQVHSKLLGVLQFPQRQRTGHPGAAKRARSPPSVSSNEESSDGFPPEPPAVTPECQAVNGKKKKGNGGDEDKKRVEGMRAVTHAIVKFGQVYERMETSRLQQKMEMEKYRIEFAKELELQHMQFFMKMQVELSQLEQSVGMRLRRSADAGTSNFNNYLNDDPSDSNSSD